MEGIVIPTEILESYLVGQILMVVSYPIKYSTHLCAKRFVISQRVGFKLFLAHFHRLEKF